MTSATPSTSSASETRYAPPPLEPPRPRLCPMCGSEPELTVAGYECRNCQAVWPLGDVGTADGEWRSDVAQCGSVSRRPGTSLVSAETYRCLLPATHAGSWHWYFAPFTECTWSDPPAEVQP